MPGLPDPSRGVSADAVLAAARALNAYLTPEAVQSAVSLPSLPSPLPPGYPDTTGARASGWVGERGAGEGSPALPLSLPPSHPTHPPTPSPPPHSHPGQQLGSLAPAPPEDEPPPADCPVILCPSRDAVAAACNAFLNDSAVAQAALQARAQGARARACLRAVAGAW